MKKQEKNRTIGMKQENEGKVRKQGEIGKQGEMEKQERKRKEIGK